MLAFTWWLFSSEEPSAPPHASLQPNATDTPANDRLAKGADEEPITPDPTPAPHVIQGDDGQIEENKPLALPYKIIDGLLVVQGDVIAGAVPQGEVLPEDGLVQVEPVKLWPNVIPYHIQPDVQEPERITQALRMFDGTAVRFVKHTNEDYALVFERGEKHCLSYVGHVVDKQPIFISPICTPANIAHEILHALGFIHEQNRSDRDEYLVVNNDSIEDEFVHNFQKLPVDFMKVSGLTDFDFKSVMLYPPWMFAKGGRSTMEPKARDNLINPGGQLSEKDVLRINKAYGK